MPHTFVAQSRTREGRGRDDAGTYTRREQGRMGGGGRRSQQDERSSAFKPSSFVPAGGVRSRAGNAGRFERRGDNDHDGERAWRRAAAPLPAQPIDTPSAKNTNVPAWMQEDEQVRMSAAPSSAPKSAASGIESIEEFKAQMREMERRQRGEPSLDSGAAAPKRAAMYADLAQEDTVAEQASRFARFFDVKNEAKGGASSGTQSPSISSIDLFGMFQNLQGSSGSSNRDATTSQSMPSSMSRANVQGTSPRPAQLAPPTAGPSAPAPQSLPVSPEQLPSQPTRAPMPENGAAPKPSAADMASMQMLMSKLMSARSQRPSTAAPPDGSPHVPPGAPPGAPPGLGPHPGGPPGVPPPWAMPPREAPRGSSAQPPGAPMTSMAFLQSLMNAPPGRPPMGPTPPAGHPSHPPPPPPPPPGLYARPPWPGVPPPGLPMHGGSSVAAYGATQSQGPNFHGTPPSHHGHAGTNQ